MIRAGLLSLAIVLAIGACGAKQPSGKGVGSGDPPVGNVGSGSSSSPVKDTRTPLEQRRDAACKAIAPKLTDCALEDAKANLAAGKIKKQQFDQDTAPEVLRKNTEKFVDECTGARDMTSRQVRVLEVCFKEEPQCGPLMACLANMQGK